MKNKNKSNSKPKSNFFVKALIYLGILVVLFVGTIWGTKYYLYDSDRNIEDTDLSAVSVCGIKLGSNISEVDLSRLTETDVVQPGCNYNYKEISFKADSNGKITYIIAKYSKDTFECGQTKEKELNKSITSVRAILGDKYVEEMYQKEVDNSRKINKYTDLERDIHLGIVYSRYNNEMLQVILSIDKIKA